MSGAKQNLDRREFILAAGAAAAVAYLPFGAAAAAPTVGAAAPQPQPQPQLADWSIDDMWGVYPRPHEAIGYAPPRAERELTAALDPVIAGLMA